MGYTGQALHMQAISSTMHSLPPMVGMQHPMLSPQSKYAGHPPRERDVFFRKINLFIRR